MTSKKETAVMLLILAILLPVIVVSCNHQQDQSYAYERQQTAKWRAEHTYISPADQAVIDMRDKKP